MSFYSKHKRYPEDRCLLNFKLKSSILLAGMISISLQAQDHEVEDITQEQAKSEVLKTAVPESVNAQLSEQVSKPEQTQSEVMPADISEPEQTDPEVMEVEALELETAQISEQVPDPMSISETRGPTCPADFYTLPLYPNAKFCQLFAEELPASMSYFAISDQESAKAFYLEQLGQADDEKMLKGRIVLQYGNGQKVVVISKDGQGSQIDILIKSAG